EYELFDDAATWAASDNAFTSQDADGNQQTTPNMLFSPSAEKFHQDFSPRDLSPYAKLVGEIAAIKKRTNQLTKQTFLIATINEPSGELPVRVAGDTQVKAGTVFDGTALLSLGAGFWTNREQRQS